MTDPHIDQFETQSYAPFAVAQMESLAVGLDPPFDPLLRYVASTVTARTADLGALLARADDHVTVTYKPAPGEADLVAEAVDVLRKLEKYAGSRDDGDAIAHDVLGGRTLTTVTRLRPARVPAALEVALKAVDKHQESLPEHAAWTKRLKAAHKRVHELNLQVHASRSQRREMTPEIAAARDAWLIAYGSLKLAVESLLRLHGKTRLMPEIFDDLAEVHRAPDVSDAPPPPAAPASAPDKTPAT